MSLLLARRLLLGGIQTFPTPLDFQLSGRPAVVAPPCGALPNPIPGFIQVHFPLFPPSPWGHKISPEQLPCTLGLGCGCNPAGAVPVL